MSDVVIRAENISKKYIIGHEKQASYSTFSESLSSAAHSIRNKILHPFSADNETTELEEFWALKDINFEIKQGDKVGIIGRNGAGKSTLLKILSRITEPTTGKIGIKGRVASLLEVGTGFHPELTGRENIFLNGAILGMTKKEIKMKFDEIVDFSGIEKFLDTPVKRYSSGMYVRLAFAVAAHLEPEILIIDEVLAVGDAEFQKKCLGKMDEVSQEGRTLIFVSHNMAAIKALCTRGLLLKNGYTISDDIINNIVALYDNHTKPPSCKVTKNSILTKASISPSIINNSAKQLITITLTIKPTFPLPNYFMIGLEDNYGNRIFTNGTHLDANWHKIKLNTTISCKFPPPSLTPGNYWISIAIGHENPRHNLEFHRCALGITVENKEANTTSSLLPGQGSIVVDANWSCS